MKVKVINEFCDAYTDEFYPEGTILEISEDRLKEIQSVSTDYVTVIEEQKKTRRRKTNG